MWVVADVECADWGRVLADIGRVLLLISLMPVSCDSAAA